jgi:hypothetical protein
MKRYHANKRPMIVVERMPNPSALGESTNMPPMPRSKSKQKFAVISNTFASGKRQGRKKVHRRSDDNKMTIKVQSCNEAPGSTGTTAIKKLRMVNTKTYQWQFTRKREKRKE